MAKVEVEILGLSASSTGSNGAYALILKEKGGERQLPIVIGAPEAQAIAAELEGLRPTRPLTHDLLKNIIEQAGGSVAEVCIVALRESIFYAEITIDGLDLHVDARPSDAVALAVRFGAPIYVMDSVLDEAGIVASMVDDSFDDDSDDDDDKDCDGDDDDDKDCCCLRCCPLLQVLDVDGDCVLSPDEIAGAADALLVIDLDADGSLSGEELFAAVHDYCCCNGRCGGKDGDENGDDGQAW